MLVKCSTCEKEFDKRPSKVREDRNFCSISCSNVRLKRSLYTICSCGGRKAKVAQSCHTCKVNLSWDVAQNKTIEQTTLNSASRAKYNDIRSLARKTMERNQVEKLCVMCGFPHPEVCHIVPIEKWAKTAKIAEVNSISNLVYLCPNHHLLLDKFNDEEVLQRLKQLNKLVI